MKGSRGAVVAVVAVGVVAAAGLLAVDIGGSGGSQDALNSFDEVTGSWRADEADAVPAPLVAPVTVTFEEDWVFAETGCNSARGGASIADGVLTAGPMATTMMACPEPQMQQEAWVVEMLEGEPSIAVSGSTLSLVWGADEQYRLELERTS